MPVRIIIAEDHDGFRELIRNILKDRHKFKIVCETADGQVIVEYAKEKNPDLILMDISLPEINGIAATHLIKEYNPYIKILGMTMHTELNFVISMLKSGASGFLLKETIGRELEPAILTIMQNHIYLSKKIEKEMFKSYLGKLIKNHYSPEQQLSEHEITVLKKLANGQSEETIAKTFDTDPAAIKKIHQKLLQSWVTYIKSLNMQDKGC